MVASDAMRVRLKGDPLEKPGGSRAPRKGEEIAAEHHVVRQHLKFTRSVLRDADQLATSLFATDRRLIRLIALQHGGGPVGLDTLAAALGEEPDTIEDVCEPYLLQIGFLARTPRGREVTGAALRHLGLVSAREARNP